MRKILKTDRKVALKKETLCFLVEQGPLYGDTTFIYCTNDPWPTTGENTCICAD